MTETSGPVWLAWYAAAIAVSLAQAGVVIAGLVSVLVVWHMFRLGHHFATTVRGVFRR